MPPTMPNGTICTHCLVASLLQRMCEEIKNVSPCTQGLCRSTDRALHHKCHLQTSQTSSHRPILAAIYTAAIQAASMAGEDENVVDLHTHSNAMLSMVIGQSYRRVVDAVQTLTRTCTKTWQLGRARRFYVANEPVRYAISIPSSISTSSPSAASGLCSSVSLRCVVALVKKGC